MTVIKSRAGTKSIYPTKSGKGEKPPAKKMSQTQKNMSEAQREAFKRAVKAREQSGQMPDAEKKRFKATILERIGQSGKR